MRGDHRTRALGASTTSIGLAAGGSDSNHSVAVVDGLRKRVNAPRFGAVIFRRSSHSHGGNLMLMLPECQF